MFLVRVQLARNRNSSHDLVSPRFWALSGSKGQIPPVLSYSLLLARCRWLRHTFAYTATLGNVFKPAWFRSPSARTNPYGTAVLWGVTPRRTQPSICEKRARAGYTTINCIDRVLAKSMIHLLSCALWWEVSRRLPIPHHPRLSPAYSVRTTLRMTVVPSSHACRVVYEGTVRLATGPAGPAVVALGGIWVALPEML